jgi:aminoglycoside phosphotransferase (APT) family kinase protein
MRNTYLGTLDYRDPLYEILLDRVCPDLRQPHFHVDRMSRSGVYRYTEERTHRAIVGKFFRLDDNHYERVVRIKSEFDKLRTIRALGFDTFPHYVVQPLAREERIGLAVVEEFIAGRDLDHYIMKAICKNGHDSLKRRLSALAEFLHAWHSRTITEQPVSAEPICGYYRRVVDKLHRQTVLSGDECSYALRLMDRWLIHMELERQRCVLVHGDATPTNFIFTGGNNVVAIDLERMQASDFMYDIGMICRELKHAFLWRRGDRFASEPYIRHFLKSYAAGFPNPKRVFRTITKRLPFFMAMTEFRIARNDYLDWTYRRRLAMEAFECLKWGLKLR